MKTKSVVLKSFEQSLKMAYNGATVKNYLFHVSSFLDFCDNVPERVNNEDFFNYNIQPYQNDGYQKRTSAYVKNRPSHPKRFINQNQTRVSYEL